MAPAECWPPVYDDVIGIRPVIRLEPPGTLPRTEFEARRVVDNRTLYEETVGSARAE